MKPQTKQWVALLLSIFIPAISMVIVLYFVLINMLPSGTNSPQSKTEALFQRYADRVITCTESRADERIPYHIITCKTDIPGRWFYYEYVNGNPEYRTQTGQTPESLLTITSDPGPVIQVRFWPIDHSPVIIQDIEVHAGHLKPGIRNLVLPGA